MRWLLPGLRAGLLLVVFLTTVGCRSNTDKVEAALRLTEESLRETREELVRRSAYTSALEHELRMLRGEVYAGQPGKPVAVFPIRTVVLGRQTGGHDSPSGQGDDGLQVIIEPQDAAGHALQVPGDAMLQVLEVSQEGHKRLLSTWYIDKEQIRSSWRVGLLAQGYNIILPWKVVPTMEKLRLLLQFRLEDGRLFEADRDVTIRLPKGMLPKPSIPVVVEQTPTLPSPKTIVTPTPNPAPGPLLPTQPMPPPNGGTPTLPMPMSVPSPGKTPVPMPMPPPAPTSTPVPGPVPAPAPKPLDGPSLGAQPRIDNRLMPAQLGRPTQEP